MIDSSSLFNGIKLICTISLLIVFSLQNCFGCKWSNYSQTSLSPTGLDYLKTSDIWLSEISELSRVKYVFKKVVGTCKPLWHIHCIRNISVQDISSTVYICVTFIGNLKKFQTNHT